MNKKSLNSSTFGLKFLDPYCAPLDMDEKSIEFLIKELKLELPPSHFLNNDCTELIARKTTNNDFVLKLNDGRISVVQLTWKSKTEIEGYLITRIYKDQFDFWKKEMIKDIVEFKE